jgi:hypothetical protein
MLHETGFEKNLFSSERGLVDPPREGNKEVAQE